MTKVVISQPMYFPWVGFFEQLKLADVFVFFDDVQFDRGFINRVQYKTAGGISWLTVPLRKHHRSTPICELEISEETDWRSKHMRSLEFSLSGTKYALDALSLMDAV